MNDSTITALPLANSIDAVNDYLAIDTASLNTTQRINRNTLLNLTSQPAGLTDTQTLTNKTLTAPTISSPTFSGTLSGTYTIGGTPTFPSSVVQLTSTQTLTNKTLTSPTINSPTITNASLTADSITGYTTSNAGTIYGVGVSGGKISSGSYLANGIVGSTQIATNGVAAANLATSAITLGYTSITTNFTTTSATAVQVTGLTSTVTIPSGSRKVKITAFAGATYATVASYLVLSIWDGTVGTGTQLAQGQNYNTGTTHESRTIIVQAIVTPSAGSKTYNIGFDTSGGTGTLESSSTEPAFILVECI